MKMTEKEYQKYLEKKTPNSTIVKDCFMAFIFGGAICTIGQAILNFYKSIGLPQEKSALSLSITLIFVGALLTGLDLYPKLAKYAGAGTVVPITGFANSVACAALEANTEGAVLGIGAKIFSIAGPVILYGACSSVIAGIIYYIMSFFK